MTLYNDYIYFNDESVREIAPLQFEQILQVLDHVGLNIDQGTIRFEFIKPNDTQCKRGLKWTFETV